MVVARSLSNWLSALGRRAARRCGGGEDGDPADLLLRHVDWNAQGKGGGGGGGTDSACSAAVLRPARTTAASRASPPARRRRAPRPAVKRGTRWGARRLATASSGALRLRRALQTRVLHRRPRTLAEHGSYWTLGEIPQRVALEDRPRRGPRCCARIWRILSGGTRQRELRAATCHRGPGAVTGTRPLCAATRATPPAPPWLSRPWRRDLRCGGTAVDPLPAHLALRPHRRLPPTARSAVERPCGLEAAGGAATPGGRAGGNRFRSPF